MQTRKSFNIYPEKKKKTPPIVNTTQVLQYGQILSKYAEILWYTINFIDSFGKLYNGGVPKMNLCLVFAIVLAFALLCLLYIDEVRLLSFFIYSKIWPVHSP